MQKASSWNRQFISAVHYFSISMVSVQQFISGACFSTSMDSVQNFIVSAVHFNSAHLHAIQACSSAQLVSNVVKVSRQVSNVNVEVLQEQRQSAPSYCKQAVSNNSSW
jgi:hypothetical protein